MNKQQIRNAIAIVKQIKNNEWGFSGYVQDGNFECFTAERNGVELWVANGPLFCGVRNKNYELGFVGGLIVWIFAARKSVSIKNKQMRIKPSTTDLTR